MPNSQIKNRDIFIFSMSDWDKEMVSNRYHMVRKLAANNRVFFFERPIHVLDWKRFPELFWPIRRGKNFYLISLPESYIGKNKNIIYENYVRRIMTFFNVQKPIFWFYDYKLGYLIDTFKPDLSCYHCTEDYAHSSRIYSRQEQVNEILNQEKKLVQKVDLVFAVSKELQKRHIKNNDQTFLTANAVDYDLYKESQTKGRGSFGSGKIIGCTGNFSAKIDFDLLDYLTIKLPDYKFVFIGPVISKNPAIKRLKAKENVVFIPKQKVEKLVNLLKEIDVFIIPYIQEEWFQKASQPLRLFEYLATGKPIVSTPMDCLRKVKNLVYIASDYEDFLSRVKFALKEKDPLLPKKRINLAKKNTWDDRFLIIGKAINNALDQNLLKEKILVGSLKYFRNRQGIGWLLNLNDFTKIENKWVIEEADRILKHNFTVLSKKRKFGPKIDWSAQFDGLGSWVKGPFQHLNQITYANGFKNPYYIGDVKLPWEFNKHLHFIVLAQSYALTSDERYAQEFVDEITDWIKENPCGQNHAWTQNLIVSHRAISWTIALGVFIHSPKMTEELWLKIYRSLNEHSDYINQNYEFGEKSSNHLLGNLAAQIILCSIFPELDDSFSKLGQATELLESELIKQVYSDGVQYEQSLSYHRIVVEFLLLLIVLKENKDLKLSNVICKTIEKMSEYLMYMTQPTGFYQPISDADGARVFVVGNDVLDARPYLALAAALFKRSDFKYVGQGQIKEIGFYLNKKQKQAYDHLKLTPPKERSKGFKDGGYYVLRQNWSKESAWLFFDCGFLGMGKNPDDTAVGTHGHSDTLNFGLTIGEQAIITDIGSYSYTTDAPYHQYFRSAKGHNVPIVDDKDQNLIQDTPWMLVQKANGQNARHSFSPEIDYLSGEHLGYQRLSDPLICHREIIFDKKRNFVLLKDSFLGKCKHQIEEQFHLYPGLKVVKDKNTFLVQSDHPISIKPLYKSSNMIVKGKTDPVEGWYALDFGRKTASPVIKINTEITAPQSLYILLNWGSGDITLEEAEILFVKLKEKSEKN